LNFNLRPYDEVVYLVVVAEVDGVFERKIHKFKVPAFDNLAYWTTGYPISESPVLNADGQTFAVSVAVGPGSYCPPRH